MCLMKQNGGANDAITNIAIRQVILTLYFKPSNPKLSTRKKRNK